MSTAKGIGLHIGLNAVDPRQYAGLGRHAGRVRGGCEGHARDHVRSRVHLVDAPDPQGHGGGGHGRHPSRGGQARLRATCSSCPTPATAGRSGIPSGEEADWEDETWVLWDRQLLDDELYALWAAFKPGVRILVLSDSCHSGSVVRDLFYDASPANAATSDRFKFIPRDVQDRTYEAHRDEYDALQQTFAKGDRGRGRGGRRADLRVPGQPVLARRRPQRPVHPAPPRGLGRRHVRQGPPGLLPRDLPAHAAGPDAELLPRRTAVERLRTDGAVHDLRAQCRPNGPSSVSSISPSDRGRIDAGRWAYTLVGERRSRIRGPDATCALDRAAA